MKAISLWQPWATLVAIGAKKIETRSWSTSYRGPLAIHAATWKPDDAAEDVWSYALNAGFGLELAEFARDLPRGVVLATCELVNVDPVWRPSCRCLSVALGAVEDCRLHGKHEGHFGNFAHGRFAWLLANVVPLDPPVPARGRQQLWNWERGA